MSGELVTMEVEAASLARFNTTLLQWKAESGKSWSEITRKSARLFCVAAAYSTQPYGDSESARKLGQAAIARDIARVYVTVSRIFQLLDALDASAAKGFYKAVRTGDIEHAREIMHAFGLLDFERLPIGPFDPSIHNQLRFRNRRGRIGRSTKPRLIVTDQRTLVAYSKRMVGRVGFAKSSWASCADAVGGSRGIPQWAKRHRAPATVQDNSNDPDPRITLTSGVKYMDTVFPDSERAKALDAARARMQSEMRHAMEATARKCRLAA